MVYRITEEEVLAAQVEYKQKYKEFRPFTPDPLATKQMGNRLTQILSTQNGMDTDDYSVSDNNKVERYLGKSEGSKLLILGTGTGREMLVAKDLGWETWGTTLGSRNRDYAVQYLGIDEFRILECANEAMPFGAESFDTIAGFQVFEHTIAPLLFLLEQGRVLKTGGTLLLEWPPAMDYTMGANPHHQICFSPGQAEALFMKAGFGDIELLYDDLTPVPVEDKWRCDQQKMLIVKGVKHPTNEGYIRRVWNG